jgi:hypothetical protein
MGADEFRDPSCGSRNARVSKRARSASTMPTPKDPVASNPIPILCKIALIKKNSEEREARARGITLRTSRVSKPSTYWNWIIYDHTPTQIKYTRYFTA